MEGSWRVSSSVVGGKGGESGPSEHPWSNLWSDHPRRTERALEEIACPLTSLRNLAVLLAFPPKSLLLQLQFLLIYCPVFVSRWRGGWSLLEHPHH